MKEIARAVGRVMRGERSLEPMSNREARSYLHRRVHAYAQSPVGHQADRTKIPFPAKWFKDGRYLDDDQNWRFTTSNSTPGGMSDVYSANRSEQRSNSNLAVIEGWANKRALVRGSDEDSGGISPGDDQRRITRQLLVGPKVLSD